jgi:hypothetical protein
MELIRRRKRGLATAGKFFAILLGVSIGLWLLSVLGLLGALPNLGLFGKSTAPCWVDWRPCVLIPAAILEVVGILVGAVGLGIVGLISLWRRVYGLLARDPYEKRDYR